MLGSRPQGNDGILYNTPGVVPCRFQPGVELKSRPQGIDGILYNTHVVVPCRFKRGSSANFVRRATMASCISF
jgi:hypothetical protein